MKTRLHLFVVLFLLLSAPSFAQEQISIFENAELAKLPDGSPCVQLNWKKGVENTAYYLVERSHNGNEFKQVALVFTAEDNSCTDYKFRDKGYSANGQALYYRIAIVNDKKEITYLPLKKVELLSAGATSVSPAYADAIAAKN